MYMFFWFFKQLFYIFKRFTKHKLLLLFVFFIIGLFIFIKPSFCAEVPYYQLDYIESNGNQYIDTGIAKDLSSTYRFVCKFSYSDVTTRQLNGCQGFLYLGVIDGYIQVALPNDQHTNIPVIPNVYNTCDVTYDCPNNSCSYTINGSTNSHLCAYGSNPGNIYLFNLNTLLYPSNCRISYWKIYKDNDLVRDFIPVIRKSDNTICFYDFVTNSFFTNNGSGSFTGGSITYPYIVNNSNTITNFSFSYLSINAVNLSFDDYYELRFTYPNVNTSYTGSIENFKSVNNGVLYFNIPKSWFTDDIVVRDGSRISFDLIRYHRSGSAVTSENYSLGSFILDLSSQEQQEINEDSNKQLLSDISKNQEQTTQAIDNLNNSQQETTEAINNLDDTIKDDNVDFEDIDLPTDDSEDITQDGVNNIFTSIYNAFCTGEARDIVFPIPFTNKNITLSANYVRQMLTNSGATWVITLIEAFWWYLISRFIIKDIMNKINKIKSGNIESIEQDNIKGDML